MIDTDKYEGLTIDDWYQMNHHEWKYVVNEHNDLLAEVMRLRKELECWGKMLEIYGINNERMSAALSFAFDDGDSSMSYLESILSLSERDLKWYEDTHGEGEEE